MTIRKVIRLGHPTLRTVAPECSKTQLESSEVQRLIDDMIETMRDYESVGIAANQVGVSLRIFVMEVPVDNRRYLEYAQFPLTIYINPLLDTDGERSAMSPEGCLSVPGLRGVTARYPALNLKSIDRFGSAVEQRLEGFPAIVVQHEVDHLNGHVYLDRLWSPAALGYEKEIDRHSTLKSEYLDELQFAP
jgi:peptide deformylase